MLCTWVFLHQIWRNSVCTWLWGEGCPGTSLPGGDERNETSRWVCHGMECVSPKLMSWSSPLLLRTWLHLEMESWGVIIIKLKWGDYGVPNSVFLVSSLWESQFPGRLIGIPGSPRGEWGLGLSKWRQVSGILKEKRTYSTPPPPPPFTFLSLSQLHN